MANSLTGMGVRLMAVSPTALTGAPCGPVIAAASSATPSATAAVSRPASAPASTRHIPCRLFITRPHSEEWAGQIGRGLTQSAGGSVSNAGHEDAAYT